MLSTPSPDHELLEVRLAPVPLRLWAALAVPFILVVVPGTLSGSPWPLLISLVGLVVALVFQFGFSWSRNRHGPVLVLDRDGLEVRNYSRVSWAQIAKMTVGQVDTGRSRFLNRLATLQYGEVVAFLPKEDVAMPPPPGGFKKGPPSWEAIRNDRYGTNLTVIPSLFTVSTRQLLDAAQRFGNLPIEHI